MPSFDTPTPIKTLVEVPGANLQIFATDRADTNVTVRPTRPARAGDVRAAERVTVTYASGVLVVSAPRCGALKLRTELVDVIVELPAKSAVQATVQVGEIRTAGNLGDCDLTVTAGEVSLETTGPLTVAVSAGSVEVGSVEGDATITIGSGAITVGTVRGAATVKSSNGGVVLGEVGDESDVRLANGAIRVDRAGGSISAKSARGDIHIGEVSYGTVRLDSTKGNIEVGIRTGTAAWLDVSSQYGGVRNLLTDTGAPQTGEQTVEVFATTGYGTVTVRPAL